MFQAVGIFFQSLEAPRIDEMVRICFVIRPLRYTS